jgi:hypothetical protein
MKIKNINPLKQFVMKFTTIILLFIISNTALIAQDTITISASDFNISGSGIDTMFTINSASISLEDFGTWTNAPQDDEFWYTGTLYIDLSNIELIDSVELDYLHACYTCFDITFYKSNGDSIFFDDPPQDSVYLYNDSIQLSSLKIWGLEAGFRKLTIYTGTSTLAIDEADINTIKVYPNPTSDIIYINIGTNYASINTYTIKIINNQSQTVFENQVNKQEFSINVSEFDATGLYFLQIYDNKQQLVYVKKIILE